MKFKSDIEVQAGLKDSSGSNGSSGQVLSSNGGTVSWVNAGGGTASDVQNQVKAGVAINKGQAVYVTSADGTNIIVGLASNTTEATSSKTLGLLNATVAINGFADVVQIGKLEGLDTSTATVGDPVWLGTNGNLIYGLANKPYAPAHLVYIGVVTRVNANNGEIFVTVQNGFELKEIHDVDIITTPPSGGDVLGFEGAPVNLWVNKTIPGWLGYTPVPTTRTLTINGSTQDLSANRTFSIDVGVTSFNTRTGAVTLTSGDVTTALGYTPVTQARTLTINGTTYDLSANRSWTVTTPETDTLATVTARGALSTGNMFTPVNGGLFFNGNGVYNTGVYGNGNDLWFNAGSTQKAALNSSGDFTVSSSVRSPIFYDSNDTTYYGDFASTSNFNKLLLNSQNSFNTTTPGLTSYGLTLMGGTSDYANGVTWTWGNTNAQAGVYVQSSGAYGTKMYFATTDSFATGSKTGMSMDHNGTVLVTRSYLQSDSSLRAPIFYDSNNTGYYIDPASTSNLNSVTINSASTVYGGLSIVRSGGASDPYGALSVSAPSSDNYAYMGFTRNGIIGMAMGIDTNNNYWIGTSGGGFSSVRTGTYMTVSSGGNVTATADFRAPIFYDSNDTSYYADFNSTAQTAIRQRGGTLHGPNTTWGAYLLVGGNGRTSYIDNALTASVCATDGNIHIDAGSGKSTYFNWYDGSSIIFGNGSEAQIGTMNSSGDLTVNSSSRAPIFYDSGNTGYYCDPSYLSNLNQVTTNGELIVYTGTTSQFQIKSPTGTQSLWVRAGYTANGTSTPASAPTNIQFQSSGSSGGTFTFCTGNDVQLTINGSGITSAGGVYGTIFYDSNNTGYYLDPNSTSNLYAANFAGPSLFSSNLGGYCGSLSNPPLQAYSSSNNSAFLSFHKGGNYAVNMGLDADNVLRIGGWSASANRWELDMSGNNWVAGSFRAPIFYDSSDTGYYVDPASTSNIRNITVSSLANSTGLTVNHSGSTPAPAAKFNSAGGGTTYGAITATFDSCNYGTAIRVVTGLWSASQGAIQFYSNTTPVGNIQCSTTTTTYSTTSDYRLKENVVAMESSIDRLKALNPCRFNFKNEPTRIVDGFIAHEVQAIIPEAVTGKKDEIDPTGEPVYQGIDQAKIVPLLTAALQEAIEKINNLEQRINILENK